MSAPTTSVQADEFMSPARKASHNYHPYMIHSTSSSLLTRSNSSPTQPLESYTRHRPSRSMSSLSAQALASSGEESEDRRRSLDLNKPSQLRRSGTLPAFPPSPSDVKKIGLELPANPKQWTPSELATYLAHTLTTEGEGGAGHPLPPVLVEDIRTWVLRQQVNGRAFLRGGDQAWGTSQRPPPFLPLLLSLSRKLRRATLQDSISHPSRKPSLPSSRDTIRGSCSSGDYGIFGAGDPSSILLEEAEGSSDDEDMAEEEQVLGVKKLVKDFDMRGSASEASGDEKVVRRRTSLSTEWRKGHAVDGRRRQNYSLSAEGTASGEMGPTLKRSSHADAPGQNQEACATSSTSPPPPYASPHIGHEHPASPVPTPQNPILLSINSSPARDSISPTPTPPRCTQTTLSREGSSLVTPPARNDSPHMAQMQSHERSGSNPYSALRRSASSSGPGQGPRLPTSISLRENVAQSRQSQCESTDSEQGSRRSTPSKGAQAWDFGSADGEDSRWTTARRVTLRPNPAKGPFEVSEAGSSPEPSRTSSVAKRDRKAKEEDMERKMGLLLARIRELEDRLQTVEGDKGVQPSKHSLLDHFGIGAGGDGLPSGLKGLPAYLFLVGLGVGVVVVKVLLGRKR